MAFQGRFQEAAKLYAKFGRADQAVDMFADLRLWEEAKTFASNSGNVDVKTLIQSQAEWAEETGDWKLASEMFCAAGQHDRAISIVGENGCLDELIEVARIIDKENAAALRKCADYFREYGHHQFAKEVYLKINDIQALMRLHVELSKWDEAFLLSEQHGGKYAEDVYLPYAQWLAENDRFDEAQVAFKRAKKPEKSMRMLKELAQSAIMEQCYDDAAYYMWLLAEENAGLVKAPHPSRSRREAQLLEETEHFRRLSQIYFAYAIISKYTDEPFSSLEPESVFNAGRFLINSLAHDSPFGVSRAAVLWAVGKQGEAFGAFKLARHAFDKLGHLRVPENWLQQIDLETMMIQSKPFSDREEHHFICYRCSTTNPLICASPNGADACVQCSHPFVRSMRSFDLLPLVEFVPDESLTDEEACSLLRSEPAAGGPQDDDEEAKGMNRVSFDAPHADSSDPFSTYLLSCDFSQAQARAYSPLVVPAKVLRQTSFEQVFIVRRPAPARRWQFFKNIIPDVRILKCPQCHSFFHEEDLETACLSNGHKCPLCKAKLAI